jgi:phage portal protein BeeE
MKPKVKTVRKKVEKSTGWDKLWLQSLESKLVGDTISEPYQQHQTVYMILDALASCMPTVDFKIYKGDNEVTEGPIVDLFMRPNSRMCRFQLWEATVLFYAYYGEAFWTFSESIGQVTGASKIPSEIWVRNPTKFNTVIRNGQFLGFRFMNTFLPSEELIQFRNLHTDF